MILLHFLKWQQRLRMRGRLQLAGRPLLSFFFSFLHPPPLFFPSDLSLSLTDSGPFGVVGHLFESPTPASCLQTTSVVLDTGNISSLPHCLRMMYCFFKLN